MTPFSCPPPLPSEIARRSLTQLEEGLHLVHDHIQLHRSSLPVSVGSRRSGSMEVRPISPGGRPTSRPGPSKSTPALPLGGAAAAELAAAVADERDVEAAEAGDMLPGDAVLQQQVADAERLSHDVGGQVGDSDRGEGLASRLGEGERAGR